jgi:alpha-N-acetylglucosaminidase
MLEAGRLLLSCSDKFKNQATYRSDCVEVMRQLFNDHGAQLYKQFSEAYAGRDAATLTPLSQEFLELIADNDKIFSAGDFTLLGTWIAAARAKGKSQAESDLMERNARQLITLWTPTPTDLSDYAYRQWGGLTRDFHLPRWKNFFDNVQKSLQGQPVPPQFTDTAFEIAWVKATTPTYPAKPETDAVETAKALFAKYEPKFAASVAAWKASKDEIKFWEWSLANSAKAEPILEWNVTKKLNKLGPGTYMVEVKYLRGNNAIQVKKAELFQKTEMAVDDASISVDEHVGQGGVATKDNAYTLTVNQIKPHAQYLLRLSAAGMGGNDSAGIITLRRIPAKEGQKYVGRWEYPADGAIFMREFLVDGTANLYANGAKTGHFNDVGWDYVDGNLVLKRANGDVIEIHKLKDDGTLLFTKQPHYGPAKKLK